MLRSCNVFHASQTETIPAYDPPALTDAAWRRPEATETILENSGAVIRHSGDRAFYSPSTDHIQLPPDGAFIDEAHWSATVLQSWDTGSDIAVARQPLAEPFGSNAYAQEEGRAEPASKFYRVGV